MNNSIITIMKKELRRFFGDRRLMLSILSPAILIYIMYSVMGAAMGGLFEVEKDFVPTVYVVDLPESIARLAEGAGMQVVPIRTEQLSDYQCQIEAQECDLVAVFPPDFDAAVAVYDTASGLSAPQVALYYNSASTTSDSVYNTMTALLDALESSMANKFDINAGAEQYDLASEEDITGLFFSSLLPMLLMMMLYSGSASVAPESIAGEKERGTIATMLITPAKRSDIAIGKILALAVIALLSGVSSAVGTILSLPKLMGSVMSSVRVDIYSMRDYLILLAVILSTVLLLVTLISLLSAYAKTVKEAQGYNTPMMLLVTLLGCSTMFSGGTASQELWHYGIPLYNSVHCMTGVFSFSVLPTGVALTIAVNGAVTLFGVFLLTKMFDSEKIIYSQ